MIVLLIPLAIVVTIFRLRGGEDVVVVDPTDAIAQAQVGGLLTVTPPAGLSSDWRPVSAVATKEGNAMTLRIGYVTPKDGALQLIESSEPVDGLLVRELGDQVRPTGVATVGTVTWDSYQVRGNESALVRKEPNRTTIVIGTADPEELRALAASVG